MRPEDVHLETRHDRQGKQTGTGLAYVQFSSPDYADEARHTKHKQMMGTRYVECMTFIAGTCINCELPATSVTVIDCLGCLVAP